MLFWSFLRFHDKVVAKTFSEMRDFFWFLMIRLLEADSSPMNDFIFHQTLHAIKNCLFHQQSTLQIEKILAIFKITNELILKIFKPAY